MATYEATGTGTTGAQYYTLSLEVNETSYSIANNTSEVSWALKLSSRNNYSFSSWSFPITANVDGEVYNENISRSMSANSTITIASGTKTIYHNSDGTKSISCSATVRATGASYLPGNIDVSGTLALTNIPRYANFTEHYVQSTGLNSITVHWDADAACDWVQYSINGSQWVDTGGLTYTVSGLTPNATYSFRTRIRRTDSQLWTESGLIYGTTKDIARVISAPDINLGDNATINITNPSGASIYYFVETNQTVLKRVATAGNNTIVFTDAELDMIYKRMGTSNSTTLRFGVETDGRYWHWQDKTCTLTGNQKTGHIKVNNSWKRTKKWVNVSGTWKRCVRWVNMSGTWKRCA